MPEENAGLYEWWKRNVPSSARLYLQTLFGDRKQPFTEKDFTPNELKNFEALIKEAQIRTQNQQPLDPNKGNVQYADYATASKNGQLQTYNPVTRQTLGRFVYVTDPNTGERHIIDNYDFSNPERDRSVAEYAQMDPFEKALAVAKNSITSTAGEDNSKSGLLGEIGNAYIGKDGRPVDIKYNPAEVKKKKGGKVKSKNNVVKSLKGGSKLI